MDLVPAPVLQHREEVAETDPRLHTSCMGAIVSLPALAKLVPVRPPPRDLRDALITLRRGSHNRLGFAYTGGEGAAKISCPMSTGRAARGRQRGLRPRTGGPDNARTLTPRAPQLALLWGRTYR